MKIFNSIEPYRLLFPIGTLFGALGVYVWIVYAFFSQEMYPGQLHSRLMLGTFLFSFVAGFLMTAIPKMTASFPAQTFELIAAFVLVLANALAAYSHSAGLFYMISAISILSVIAFFVRRFRARTKTPPSFFPFVIIGLASGFFGALLLSISSVIPAEVVLFARKIYFEGMILLLVMGIGSRLIPVITGRGMNDDVNYQKSVERNLVLGFGLVFAFLLEGYGLQLLGGGLKCLIVTCVAILNWGLFAKSKTKSRLAIGIRISGLMVLFGIYMSLFQPNFAVHWMHLTYVAGFGLMTLTVASRVTLAHGSYDLSFEAKSNALWVCGALVLTAAATRVAAPFTQGYVHHLGYAAIVWVLAIAVWGVVFVRRMIWKGSGPKGC